MNSVLENKKVLLYALGCKVNQYENDAMLESLEAAGAVRCQDNDIADICIINTCSVTNVADRKSRQIIHRLKKQNPNAIIAATGCYVQAAAEELKSDNSIDVLVGNNRKKDIVRLLSEYLSGQDIRDNYIDVNQDPFFEDLTIKTPETHTRAYIKIQDGCNNFCTYCIIPYVRGRIKSKDISEILEETKTLAKNGVKEVVLTGINLSSYDDDTSNSKFIDVIQAVSKVEGIERIRLGSLEPRVITDQFLEIVSSLPNFCPHFHLSLQSASNATLERMNRKYTIEEFIETCDRIRRYFDRPALTSDVIVGFAGETEEEFAETVKNLERINFYEMHVFKYSKRKGTPAAKMSNQVPETVKSTRSDILLEMSKKNSEAYEASFKGEKLHVLIEEIIEKNGKKVYRGHTERYILVDIPFAMLGDSQASEARINTIVTLDY